MRDYESRWGALHGPAEVLDAGANALRIEVADSGVSVTFEFGGSGPATAFEMRGEIFRRQ